MGDIFLELLNRSITAGWLILAILCIRLLFRKIPKWVNCLLWCSGVKPSLTERFYRGSGFMHLLDDGEQFFDGSTQPGQFRYNHCVPFPQSIEHPFQFRTLRFGSRYFLAVYPLASGLLETVALPVKVLYGGRYPCISYGHG